MEKHVMTVKGQNLLREELKTLKSKDRPEIILAIATAREFGDLKENAEYHAAKERQSFIEGRINDIESKLSSSEVIDITKLNVSGTIVFGSTVTVFDLDKEQNNKYKIVGEDEANIDKGLISYKAPLSRSLIGKSIDDEVELLVGDEKHSFQIIDIQYI
tara:strand:+ start:683 stop:1159 length:477 start_codon:yes stop_codon:yes gene_type:complete